MTPSSITSKFVNILYVLLHQSKQFITEEVIPSKYIPLLKIKKSSLFLQNVIGLSHNLY